MGELWEVNRGWVRGSATSRSRGGQRGREMRWEEVRGASRGGALRFGAARVRKRSRIRDCLGGACKHGKVKSARARIGPAAQKRTPSSESSRAEQQRRLNGPSLYGLCQPAIVFEQFSLAFHLPRCVQPDTAISPSLSPSADRAFGLLPGEARWLGKVL